MSVPLVLLFCGHLRRILPSFGNFPPISHQKSCAPKFVCTPLISRHRHHILRRRHNCFSFPIQLHPAIIGCHSLGLFSVLPISISVFVSHINGSSPSIS